MTEILCFKNPPAIEQAAIRAQQQQIKGDSWQTLKLERRVGFAFGEYETERKRSLEQQCAAQL